MLTEIEVWQKIREAFLRKNYEEMGNGSGFCRDIIVEFIIQKFMECVV